MPQPKVAYGPLTPYPHEVIVKTRTNCGTDHRNQARGPLLNNFSARTGRNALNHARNKFRHNLLLDQLATDVHSGCAGRRHPEFGLLLLSVVGEAVNQAEFLNHANGNGGKDSKIRNDGEHAAHTETSAFNSGNSHAAAYSLVGD